MQTNSQRSAAGPTVSHYATIAASTTGPMIMAVPDSGGEANPMTKGRLGAFSDGVIAIIITIMVLEMKVPHGDRLQDLRLVVPVFLSYILSFLYVGIYWNNHHHMLHACNSVTGGMLWANLHLLFWLSLFPFATGWMGKTSSPRRPPRCMALCY